MAKQLSVNYSLNTGSKWVYCNYPEKPTVSALGDSSYGSCCVNSQTVDGTGQIFYSYNTNQLTTDCNFGIRVYNPGSSAVTITRTNYGHSNSKTDGGWDAVPVKSWERFFKSTSKTFSVPAKKSVWISEESAPKGTIFSGNLRMTTTGSVVVAAYFYKTKANIPDSTSIYPYDINGTGNAQYSGYGNGYFFTASEITIKLSDLVNNNGAYFETNSPTYSNVTVNGSASTDELIPIHIAGTSYVAKKGANRPLSNIANWCAQYFIPIKLVNDIGGTKQVQCWIEAPSNVEQYAIVNCGGTLTSKKLNFKGDTHVFKTISVSNTASFNYQFIFGTNSSGYVKHMFRVLP